MRRKKKNEDAQVKRYYRYCFAHFEIIKQNEREKKFGLNKKRSYLIDMFVCFNKINT